MGFTKEAAAMFLPQSVRQAHTAYLAALRLSNTAANVATYQAARRNYDAACVRAVYRLRVL